MARQTPIFLMALACSLGLHLLGVAAYVGINKEFEYRTSKELRRVAMARSTTRPSTQPTEIGFYPELGEDTGTGIGSNAATGQEPQIAPKADEDQALLTRNMPGMKWQMRQDPPGPQGDGSPPAISAVAPPTEAIVPARPHEETENVKPPLEPVKIASALPLSQAKAGSINSQTKAKIEDTPTPPTPAVTTTAKPQNAVEAPPTAQKTQQTRTAAEKVGSQEAVGEPRQKSDSDSDIFSRISETFIFHAGKLEARKGRKVKTTTPQVKIAGQIDLWTLENPTVVLEVRILPRRGK